MAEPQAMRAIHKIRERIYAETRDMTPEERAAPTRRDAQKMVGKHGLRLK